MFIVPDELLEMRSMYCDFCHKFLSVGPVKVYRNKKTKCGRCSSDDDDGIVSKYNSFAEQGIFKCINRFDGCRKLLSYSQVADHEKSCESKTLLCPVCSETVATFLLINHFREAHGDNFLVKPFFKVGYNCPDTKTYLFRVKDNLFFIECRNISISEFGLNTTFLGNEKTAKITNQKFVVQYGDEHKLETPTQACDSLDYQNRKYIVCGKPEMECSIFVKLTIEENFDFISILTDKVKPAKRQQTVGIMRNISLTRGFQQDHPEFSTKSAVLHVGTSVIYPCCHNCSLPVTVVEKYLEIELRKYQPICAVCEKFYLTISREVKLTESEELHEFSPYNHIMYSCMWGCTGMYHSGKILQHESECLSQPKQSCPVPSCTYRGKLFSLKEHFEEIHPEDSISLLPTFSIHFPHSLTQKWYVWVQDIFLSIGVYVQSRMLFEYYYDSSVTVEPLGLNITTRLKPKLLMWSTTETYLFSDLSKTETFEIEYLRDNHFSFLCYFEADHPF